MGKALASTRLLSDVLYVWQRVYFEELQWFPTFSEALLDDGYAEQSIYLVARATEDRRAIGTARLVLSRSGRLPVERFVDLSNWTTKPGGNAELTRLMVIQEHRKGARPGYPNGVYRSLMKAALHWCQSAGIGTLALNVRARGEPNSIIGSLDVYGARDVGLVIHDEFDSSNPRCAPVLIDVDHVFASAAEAGGIMRFTQDEWSSEDAVIAVLDERSNAQGA